MVTFLGFVALAAVTLALAYRHARRRIRVDKYADLPPVRVIPTRR